MMDSWVQAPPVVPFVPNSGTKPKWAYFPNGPPPTTPKTSPVAKASPDIFFVRDIFNFPTPPGQEAATMCWTLGPPPPGWTPPAPPPAAANVSSGAPPHSPAPPPVAEKSSPLPAAEVQHPDMPSIKGWTLVLPPAGGWDPQPPPPPTTPTAAAANPMAVAPPAQI